MFRILLTSALAWLAAGAVFAQRPEDFIGPPMLQFSFSNPGARSMGFGGAFVALADDATAAFANPAGLVQISRPEFSLEGRSWSYSTPFTEQGRFGGGEPTGIGVDVVAGLATATSEDDLAGVSFLSFVYPQESWSIAFYRHRLAEFESLTRTLGLFGEAGRHVEQRVRTDLEVTGYGLSGAYRVSDAFSLGLSLVYFDGYLDLVGERYLPDEDEALGSFAQTSYLPERSVARTALSIDDGDWGLTAGWLLSLSERWRFGGFYRQGPAFELHGETSVGPGASFFPSLPPAGTSLGSGTSPSAFPDVYGLGLTYRPAGGRLTVAFEWDRVEYSTILDSLDPEAFDDVDRIDLSDGAELRLGAEYVFRRFPPVAAARFGAWLDPDHRPNLTAAGTPLERALLPPGDDELHVALGLGLAFEHFQIDLGADFSELVDTVSLSTIYAF